MSIYSVIKESGTVILEGAHLYRHPKKGDQSYKVDISIETSKAGHNARLKCTINGSTGPGTSCPINYGDKSSTYDALMNDEVRRETKTEHILPILVSFTVQHHEELSKIVQNGACDLTLVNDLKPEFEDFFNKYIDDKGKVDKNAARNDAYRYEKENNIKPKVKK